MTLTYTQIRVMHWLHEFHREHGFMPTSAEMASHFGWASPNNSFGHIDALVRRGALTKVRNVSRGLRFTDEGTRLVGVIKSDGAPAMVGLRVLEYWQVKQFAGRLAGSTN